MTTRRPATLRWAEEAEAEHMRTEASFEREPHSAAVRPVAFAPLSAAMWYRPALLPWLFSRLGAASPQIERDDDWRNGVI